MEKDKETETTVHVSADQRYELSLDGRLISLGPDRGDLMHWSLASYRLKLAPGSHSLEALVAWIGDDAPCAQITHQGGFIFAAEGPLSATLNTGERSGWKVNTVQGAKVTLAWAESLYTLDAQGKPAPSKGINHIQPLLVRGLQMCAHETYMDCPTPEMEYLGSTPRFAVGCRVPCSR